MTLLVKILTGAIISFFSVSYVIAATSGEIQSQRPHRNAASQAQRLGGVTSQVGVELVDHDFVIPVAGNTPGGFGTHWKSEVVLSNYRSRAQRVRITFYPMADASDPNNPKALPPSESIYELPPFESKGELGLVTEDFMGMFGKTGLAAVLVEAIDSTGKPQTDAYIDGYSRIWTLQPEGDPSQPCSPAQRGTVSQGMMTVTPDSIVGHEYPGFAVGLRQDDTYRTNVGIVNLAPRQVSWIVEVIGTRASTTFKMTVPAKSMLQRAIPAGNYGTMSIAFNVDDTSLASGDIASQHTGDSDLLWNAYASSVDNRSGDGWTRQASY